MADRHCDFITGNDTTGTGDALLPFKTMARGVGTGFAQGDKVIIHNDEVITAAVTIPAMTSRATINSIVGVNKVTGLEDGSRIKITQTGNVSWLSAGNTYQWSFRNFLIEGFVNAVPLATTATIAYGGAEWFNCKFSTCGAISTSQLSTLSTFRKCIFEDIVFATIFGAGATLIGKMYSCIFRRIAASATATYVMAFIEAVDCIFVDSTFPRYGVGLGAGNGIVFDRITMTGTGNVDNVLLGNNSNISVNYFNVLATNIRFLNTPTTANKAVLGLFATVGTILTIGNFATWNIDTANMIKKTSAGAVTNGAIVADNAGIALTESPWKNDDGIISNPMSCYEYKESYLWRRKNQLLTDISGWSYPT